MSVKSYMNSIKKMNERTYPNLKPDERFKLFIKSFAEEDEQQIERLVETCPRYDYRITDPVFTKRIEFSKEIVTAFLLQFLEYEKIISIQLLLEQLNEKPELDDGKIYSKVLGFIEAFEEFSKEHLGIDSQELINAWYTKDNYTERVKRIKQLATVFGNCSDNYTKENWYNRVYVNAWNKQIIEG
ncbi:hypothetical protein [Bacillus sp. FJAT-45350]|uniref:hypothetical protein n=1 Tax=Bacillus sp. FJAT-45350 TaxID=2011014 RepID=UPI000BB8501E|nr:hypothetical protein [Bacillus sp. FJAT-45350]